MTTRAMNQENLTAEVRLEQNLLPKNDRQPWLSIIEPARQSYLSMNSTDMYTYKNVPVKIYVPVSVESFISKYTLP